MSRRHGSRGETLGGLVDQVAGCWGEVLGEAGPQVGFDFGTDGFVAQRENLTDQVFNQLIGVGGSHGKTQAR